MQEIEKINLTKLKNCAQVWDSMKPKGCGRHCESCDRIIHDFRIMSDREIAEKHLFSDEPVCGVYNKEQLQAPVPIEVKRPRAHFKTLYLAAIGFLFQGVANAQDTIPKPKQVQTDEILRPSNKTQVHIGRATNSADSLVFRGTVFDENNDPVPFAAVVVQGTVMGVSTDFDGKFLIDLTQVLDTVDQVFLEFSSVGYEKQQVLVEADSNREIIIQFQNAEMIAFSVLVEPIPWHKKWWYKTKNVFRRK